MPETGGANIADLEGTAHITRDGASLKGTFQVHVEDRGTGYETEDYFAVRILDAAGEEVIFDANYLQSGDIELVPTNNNFPVRV